MLSGLLARGYQNTCFAGPVTVQNYSLSTSLSLTHSLTLSLSLSLSLSFFQLTVLQQQVEYLEGLGEEVLCVVLNQLEVVLIRKSDLLYLLLAVLSLCFRIP